ncbi:MAG: recombination protein O N-terminal domain-containing protein [Candidatus Kaiserbacteria bacterium]|nr:recombination protein O N-terminal domain-containing protein [Candidatus Kaiserbacteria bacterium]
MRGSYPILTTDAFIIYTRGVGEADRIITVLTKSNGLMNIYARSIRKDGAKMRGDTKPYARVSLSVVLGKRTILKDITITDTLDLLWRSKEKYTAFVTLLHRLRTLIPITESCDASVFQTIETATRLLQESEPEHAQHILLIAQVMVLAALGYVSDQAVVPTHFEDILMETVANPHRQKVLQQHLRDALYHQ